ncbi:MAG: hypothetical protein ACSHXW_18905 [Yoonia sp.]
MECSNELKDVMVFEEPHLTEFKKTIYQTETGWAGCNPRKWVAHLSPEIIDPNIFPDRRLIRQEIFDMANCRKTGDLYLAINIAAWGGMKRDHGRRLFDEWPVWAGIMAAMRDGLQTRQQAYYAFSKLRLSGELPGMGPAYFTKMIFFALETRDAFIMDQWTARSANLLLGRKLVNTLRAGASGRDPAPQWVSDENTPEVYEKFCHFIHELAKQCSLEGEEESVEEALFSTGRGRGRWRNYVISQDRRRGGLEPL